jgi:hypothetical protein
MADSDISGLVERLSDLGLILSTTPLADGSLRLNQWRTVRYYDNEALIKTLWSESVVAKPGRAQEIARFLAPRVFLRKAA